jgi:hypothetical protein
MPTAIMIEIAAAIATNIVETIAIGIATSQLYLRQTQGGC